MLSVWVYLGGVCKFYMLVPGVLCLLPFFPYGVCNWLSFVWWAEVVSWEYAVECVVWGRDCNNIVVL